VVDLAIRLRYMDLIQAQMNKSEIAAERLIEAIRSKKAAPKKAAPKKAEPKEGSELPELIAKIQSLNEEVNAADRSKFDRVILQATTFARAVYLMRKDPSEIEGCTNVEQLGKLICGWGKAYANRMNQVGCLDTGTVIRFVAAANQAEESGKQVVRGMKELLSFAKSVEEDDQDSTDAEKASKVKTVVSFTAKIECVVSLRIDEDGVIHTKNSVEEINAAFMSILDQLTPR